MISFGTSVFFGGIDGGTSGSIDTSGANFLIAAIAGDNINSWTFSDSKSNTWVSSVFQSSGFTASIKFYYAYNATVGSGHTFSISCTAGSGIGMIISSFNAVKSASDPGISSTSFTTSSGTSLAPGGLAGDGSDDLFATALTNHTDTSDTDRSINNAYTIIDQKGLVGGVHYPIAAAYRVFNGTLAPTWSWTTGAQPANAIHVNFAPEAVTATVKQLAQLGVG